MIIYISFKHFVIKRLHCQHFFCYITYFMINAMFIDHFNPIYEAILIELALRDFKPITIQLHESLHHMARQMFVMGTMKYFT